MQRNKERLALYFDLKLESVSTARGEYGKLEGLAPKTLAEMVEYVSKLKDDPKQELVWPKRTRGDVLYLVDMVAREGDDHVVLLINRCDPDAADSVFYDPATGTRTRHEKKPGEGADHSSHVALSLTPVSPNVYRAIVEMCPGLSSARIEAFLNYLFRICCMEFKQDFTVEHLAGAVEGEGAEIKPVRVRTKQKCKMMGHLSPEFEQELREGKLTSIELIRLEDQGSPWDDAGELVENSRTVKIRESAPGAVAEKWEAIQQLCGRVKDKYGQVRVTFRTTEGLTRTAKLETEGAAFAHDSKYIKKRLIDGFEKSLPAAFDAVDEEMRGKLCALL